MSWLSRRDAGYVNPSPAAWHWPCRIEQSSRVLEHEATTHGPASSHQASLSNQHLRSLDDIRQQSVRQSTADGSLVHRGRRFATHKLNLGRPVQALLAKR